MGSNLTCDGQPFGVCAIRAAKLDNNGVPLPGAANIYVSLAPVEMKLTEQVKSNIRYDQTDGCGHLVTSVTLPDQIQGLTAELTLCKLDAELLGFLTGGTVIHDVGGNTIGFYAPPIGTITSNGVAIEYWVQKIDGQHGDPVYPYYRKALPKVIWRQGDEDNKEGVTLTPVLGVCYENPNFYHGPLHDWPQPLETINGWILDTKLPDATCEPEALPAS